MSKWQPIETAPKDAVILVYDPTGVEVPDENRCWPEKTVLRVVQAHWYEPSRRTRDEPSWYASFTSFYGGVWDDPSCEFDAVSVKPTHWMPLPEPPK